MKLFYTALIVVLFSLVLAGCLSQQLQSTPSAGPAAVENTTQQSSARQIDLSQYTDSSSRFIAEIANELLKATSG